MSIFRRAALAATAVVALPVSVSSPAFAGGGGAVASGGDASVVTVVNTIGGSGGGGGGGGTGGNGGGGGQGGGGSGGGGGGGLSFADVGCSLSPAGSVPEGTGKPGTWYSFTCTGGMGGTQTGLFFVPAGQNPSAPAVPLIDPIVLARQLRNRLDLPTPAVSVSPDGRNGNPALVNLPTWWWVTNSHAITQRTSLGVVWAEVTATPVSSTWTTSSGDSSSCTGIGVPWSEGASSGCTYTYASSNAAEVATVTVTWEVTWRGYGGAGGTLDPFYLSTQVPNPVYERHALVTH